MGGAVVLTGAVVVAIVVVVVNFVVVGEGAGVGVAGVGDGPEVLQELPFATGHELKQSRKAISVPPSRLTLKPTTEPAPARLASQVAPDTRRISVAFPSTEIEAARTA